MSAAPASANSSQRSALLHAAAVCDLSCAVCDCATSASSPDDIARTLRGGGDRLVVRGACEQSSNVAEIVGRAREEGFTEIVLRTNAAWCRSAEDAATFARLGGDVALIPIFSQMPAVHDRIAGVAGALRDTLRGMVRLARTGLGIEIEVPILQPRLQTLEDIVHMTHRAVPTLRAVHLFLPPEARHRVLTPPSWPQGAPNLAAALLTCRDLGVTARLSADAAVPLCALRDFPDLYDSYAINPKARSSTRGTAILGATCTGCAVRAQCAGIAPSYRAAHGEDGITPYDHQPKLMYEQRTTRRREWTPQQRAAAAKASLLVIRPTVNCNQDCTFCSANETSANVWTNHDEMLRAIARAARRGIEWLSFSGGEPTLSKHLPEYIRCATRLGIARREIVSNAVLLDRPDKVATLVAAGLTDAFISLHAHDEALSRQSTQKVDDFERTVAGIKNLIGGGVRTALNHVITARNYPYLQAYVEFVRREFGGKVKISFAFVTPQFKALDNIEVMPRLTEVMPYLKRAMYRAIDLAQPFAIGSRQGIPFCFLDEFRAWSDGLKLSNSAIAEDSPQKQRAPVCDECRFSNHCTGLWRPYVAKYGLEELRAVAGGKLTDREIQGLEWMARLYPWGEPMAFDEVSEALRERELETGPPEIVEPSAAETLPEFVVQRTRPLRILMVGSGRQARRIARAARNVPGLSIDAVASPHAPDADVGDFGDCPTYRDAVEAIEDIRPEGVIIAAATSVHEELAKAAIDRGIPTLVEKPIANTAEAAMELRGVAAAADVAVLPAHNSIHATGLGEIRAGMSAGVDVSYLWRRTVRSSDSLRTWSRSFLYETVYHVIAVVRRACAGGEGEITQVSFRGEAAPEQLRIRLRFGDAAAEIVLEFAAAEEEDILSVRERAAPATSRTWRRSGRDTTIDFGGTTRPVESSGSDIECMLANFRDVILGNAEPAATLDDAIDVMRTARAVVDALSEAGTPFERPNAPRHVASRSLQQGM